MDSSSEHALLYVGRQATLFFFFFGGEADANTQALKSGGSGEVLE